MNRFLKSVLVPVVVLSIAVSAAGAATAGRPPRKVAKTKSDATPASVSNRVRKQVAGDGDQVASSRGGDPSQVGRPNEQHLTKASGKHFDLRNLPATRPVKRERPEREAPPLHPVGAINLLNTLKPELSMPFLPQPNAPAPAPIMNFDGLDFQNWGAGHPPDTNGDVGPTYYIQTINTSIGVFRKSDGVRVAAFTFDTFMSQGSFGNLCDTDNFGDPVVLYDSFEDRWVITDFAFQLDASNNVINPPGSFQCFAVSMTGDPVTGGWNYYSIPIAGGLGDYPKLGIWPDGLYMSANVFGYAASASFQNSRLYALNKAQMYAGSPTVKVVSFDLPSSQFTVLPANARVQTGTPPAGSPNYFASIWNFLNSVQIWKFHVDWDHIPLSTVTGPIDSTMAFWWAQYLRGSVETAPTPANALDTLYPRLMVQNQYSNIGGVESLWESHTVGAGNPTSNVTSSQSAVRYYQIGVTGGTVATNMAQSFTYSPDATVYRYMPSVAVNRAGDMAIGYTTSNGTTNPALKYAGRLSTDPVNSISLTEQTLQAGTGSQSGNCGGTCERWGDYSAMTIDPDGCTFWYTNEYYVVNGLNHLTRIGSFAFPSCTPVGAGGTISGTVTIGGSPLAGATVQFGARKTTTTNASGFYSISGVPAGTYPSLTASYIGYTTATASSIPVTDGGTTTRNFALTAASSGSCYIDTTQADFQSGLPTNVDLTTTPGNAVLTKPDLLDQVNPQVSPTGFGFTNTAWVGQTFTPAISGQLVRADVELFCSGCSGANPNITISIRATTGSPAVPTGADLATTTLAGFNDGAAGGLKTVTFATPATVTAGTRYALIVRAVAARTGTYAYTCSCATTGFLNSNPYANGQRVTSANSGTTWTADTTTGGRDLNFALYINNGYSTTGNLVSGNKDAAPSNGMTANWTSLAWTATTPASTSVKLQVAGSNSANGPFNFVGPDGTAATFFTTSPASMPTAVQGSGYLQYKAYLGTSVSTSTPTLSDVQACFTDVSCGSSALTMTTATVVCANSTGNTASVPSGSASYSWSVGNGTITAGAGTNSITYTAGSSGVVTITINVIDVDGCHRIATAPVPVDAVPTPSITPSGPTTFCSGGSVQLTSSSGSGNQWYLGGVAISGATASTYSAAAGGSYTVRVTDANACSSALSAPVVVTVNALPPQPTIAPAGSVTFCFRDPTTLTSSSATGNQWYAEGTLISGATNQTLVVTKALMDTYSVNGNVHFTVTVTDGNGCSSTSAPKLVTVLTPGTPQIEAAGPTTFCAGGSVSLQTTIDGLTGKWYRDGVEISGETGSTYTATMSGSYTFVSTFYATCPSDPSNAILVTVNPLPATPTITPGGPTTFCSGGSVTLTSSSATGNQWNLNGNPIGGETGPSYIATATGNYSVTVTISGCSATSSDTSVTVNPLPPTPTITPGGPTTFCTGGTVTLTSSSATGNQWNLNGNPIGGETGPSYIATATGNYSVTVTDANNCSATSSNTSVTVNPLPPTPTITPGGPTTFCAGGTVTLTSSSATGNHWNLNGNPIGGATGTSYMATATGLYSVTVTDGNGCSATSTDTSVTVNPLPPTPTITPGGPTTFCAGGSVTLTSSSATGNQWNLNGNPISGETGPSYIAAASGNYSVTVTDANNCSATSANTVVTVNPLPAAPTISSPTTKFCPTGDPITLTSTAPVGNLWYRNGVIIPTATGQTYDATQAGDYTATATDGNGCTSVPSNTISIVNNVAPTLNPIGPKSVSEGSLLTFTISGNDTDNDTLTYSATDLPGGASFDTATHEFSWTPGFGDAGPHSVTFSVSDGCATASETIVITVDNTNRPPVLDAVGNKTATVGVALTFTLHATDPDTGDSITYSANNLPSGATLDPSTGAFSWTPTVADVGSYSITFTADDGHPSGTDSETITISVPPLAPTDVVATATSSTSVDVTWHGSTGAVSYKVMRRGAGELFGMVGTSSTTSLTDNTAVAGHAYLYAVIAINDDGDESPMSGADLASTFVYSEALVQNTTTLKATQIYETRTAVNEVRALAGLTPPATFTDAVLENVTAKTVHIDELRVALNEGLTNMGFLPVTFTDPTLTPDTTPIKAVHVGQVRNAMQ